MRLRALALPTKSPVSWVSGFDKLFSQVEVADYFLTYFTTSPRSASAR